MTELLLGIIAVVGFGSIVLLFALTLILWRQIMALLEKVDRAVTVLEDLHGAFEQFLDGVISIEPEEFNDEDDNFGDEWEEEEIEEGPKKKKGKK